MFGKLRNRLILINLSITTLILILTFTFVYISSVNSADRRPPIFENDYEMFDIDMEHMVIRSVESERRAAAQNLLINLLLAGVIIEVVVVLASYLLAETAIRPVRDAYDSQKIFIANASHEIKTPLAAISANLEAADIHNNKWISNAEKEVAKLTSLNNELLALARTDLIDDAKEDEVELDELIKENLKVFEPRLNKIHLTKKFSTRGKVKLASMDYIQIFNILMDNAVKYCDKEIKLFVDNHKLIIENDGAKISQKNLPHIFERFYQADKSTDGVGLGLSIAKTTADRNKWTLSAESDKKMTRFILTF